MQLYDKYGSPIITNSYVTKSQRWAHCNRNPLCVVKSTITDFRWQIQQQQKCSWNILRGPSPVKNGLQMPKHCLEHENENKHWIRHYLYWPKNNRRSFGPAKPCSVRQNLNGRRTKCPVNLLSFGEDWELWTKIVNKSWKNKIVKKNCEKNNLGKKQFGKKIYLKWGNGWWQTGVWSFKWIPVTGKKL